MPNLWDKQIEEKFFREAQKFASSEQLFYITMDNRYVAYWPTNYHGPLTTLQSRNSLIGNFTEKWTRDLIDDCIREKGLYAIQSAVCGEIALSKKSPGDVIISRRNSQTLSPEDIVAIFEVKMSVVWNWELKNNQLSCIGDYKTHQGNPGMLRSDSMLKGIGKSINIRVSSQKAWTIPLIIIGNTPITKHYHEKVDQLIISGMIQGFWSVNPNPLDDISNPENLSHTPKMGFIRFEDFGSLKQKVFQIISEEMHFFSSMKPKNELGRFIEIANRETTYEQKAEKFLKLLQG